jgi:hypothetical protein
MATQPAGPDDPWGTDDPPAVSDPPPLPPALAELAALSGPLEMPRTGRSPQPRADELPEVRELIRDGWRVANPSPMWSFLPAVWPEGFRCWVPDRLPRFSRSRTRDDVLVITPWSPETAGELHAEVSGMLAKVGFPPPPAGRIWMLRSPWPSIGVEPVLGLILLRANEAGGGGRLDGVLVEAARDVLTWDEERVWDWWPGEWGVVARAWRAQGRTGEDAAPLIIAKLPPELLEAFREHGFDDTEALDWMLALSATGVLALERAEGWRGLGYGPGDVLIGLMDREPSEAARWLEDGFSLSDLRAFKGAPLETAREWRAAGVSGSEARELLWLDHRLTPAEARAFTDAGISPEDRRDWVRFGFDAAAARNWTDLDVYPGEARVWRAQGYDPASAADVLADLAPGTPRLPKGHFAWVRRPSDEPDVRPRSELGLSDPAFRRSVHYSVEDPPGTRGVDAER